MDCCPRLVYKYDKRTKKILVSDKYGCNYCDECITTADELLKDVDTQYNKQDMVDIHNLSADGLYDFIFVVESTGALPPEQIVLSAIDVISEKLKTINEAANPIDNVEFAVNYY